MYRARLAADEGAERIAPTEYVFAAASGTGLEDLSEWMGHTSLNLTWKTYRHLYPEAAEAARLRLDAYLAPSTIELRGLTRSIEDSPHRNSDPPRPV